MPSSSVPVRKANKATAGDLAISVPQTYIVSDKQFSFTVKTTPELCDDEQDQIWQMFEENMAELYRSSSFGWHPRKKSKEMFHTLSRFVIVRDAVASSRIIAYSIFRFERDGVQDVVYCYELQVSNGSRLFGLGKLLMQILSDIGTQWGMTKTMLTVFKANHAAMSFYRSIGFAIDEDSADFVASETDYSILSRCLW